MLFNSSDPSLVEYQQLCFFHLDFLQPCFTTINPGNTISRRCDITNKSAVLCHVEAVKLHKPNDRPGNLCFPQNCEVPGSSSLSCSDRLGPSTNRRAKKEPTEETSSGITNVTIFQSIERNCVFSRNGKSMAESNF